MRIALRHDRRLMPEQTLDFVDVHPGLHESGRKNVRRSWKRKSSILALPSANLKARRRNGPPLSVLGVKHCHGAPIKARSQGAQLFNRRFSSSTVSQRSRLLFSFSIETRNTGFCSHP